MTKLITILSLALSTLVIIQLRPQMELSPKTEIRKSQPFSVPFSIHNLGYLAFTLRRAVCFAFKVKVGGGTIENSGMGVLQKGNTELESGHNETVFCRLGNFQPSEADIAIVIDYTPLGFPPAYTSRKYFRFVGVYGDTWEWIDKPMTMPMKEEVDRGIKRHETAEWIGRSAE